MISQIDIDAFKEDQAMATRELTPEERVRVLANLTTNKVKNYQKYLLETSLANLKTNDSKPAKETKL